MQNPFWLSFILFILLAASCQRSGNQANSTSSKEGIEDVSTCGTLCLFPENNRYLEYQGKPVILITSAEHYGGVLNLDFDYKIYLETLEKEGFNYTRIFSGTYIEPVNNIFGIAMNTLAPQPGRFIAPWTDDQGMYDLDSFNPEFFSRLKDFVNEAQLRDIIVEITLFTSIYAENSWLLSPLNPANNVNIEGKLDFHRINTLHNGMLLEYQEKYIRKVVSELNGYDNIFFEIQNEPWSDNPSLVNYVNLEDDSVFKRPWQKKVEVANGVSSEWQAWVASVIKDEELALPKDHLIARNISNYKHDLQALPEDISMINFHYALSGAVTTNLDLGGVLGLDETGFMPHNDELYINQAWRFILSGGGLYNNLDYSFTVGNEDGTWPIPESNPGWGGPGFRKKLTYMVKAMNQVPFYDMEFSDSIVRSNDGKIRQYGLQNPGTVYLVFLESIKNTELIPNVPSSRYVISWLNIHTGENISEEVLLGQGKVIQSPFNSDIAVLQIEKKD